MPTAQIFTRLGLPPASMKEGVMIRATSRQLLAGCVLLALADTTAQARQTTGTPGSPNATATIPGNQLPAPPPKFGGVMNEQLSKSKPWWPPRVAPSKGAPNVLLIMTDDAGYG